MGTLSYGDGTTAANATHDIGRPAGGPIHPPGHVVCAPLRILQIHTRYRRPGGEDVVVESEAAVLRDAGHEVVQWRAANGRTAPKAAMQLPLAPWNPWAHAKARRLARRVRPDVVHVHNTWFALSHAVVDAIRSEGVPVAATLHNYRLLCANGLLFRNGRVCEDCVGSNPLPGVRHRCYRGSLPQSAIAASAIAARRVVGAEPDRLVVLNEFARDLFARSGIPGERLHVKPNFAPDPGPRPEPPSASRRVLFVGRLNEEKGVETLLRAWSAAKPPGLTLTVVGDGPLRATVKAAGEGDATIEPVPWMQTTALAQLLGRSRALLMPSRWYEGQPRVALEGMAAGLPILGSAIGGLGQLLGGGDCGAAVRPDLDGWTGALPLLAGAAWVDRAGAAARRRYLTEFDERAGLRGLEALYRELV